MDRSFSFFSIKNKYEQSDYVGMANRGESVTIPIEIGPPKYQTTIPKKARRILECDGERVILDAELTVRKVIDEEGGDS